MITKFHKNRPVTFGVINVWFASRPAGSVAKSYCWWDDTVVTTISLRSIVIKFSKGGYILHHFFASDILLTHSSPMTTWVVQISKFKKSYYDIYFYIFDLIIVLYASRTIYILNKNNLDPLFRSVLKLQKLEKTQKLRNWK